MNCKNQRKFRLKMTARECAYLAAFVSLVIASQVALATIPGVEVVTLLFVVYAFVFGARRGMLSATAFSFLRMFIFGFDMKVLVLYLLYFNALTALFGWLGHITKRPMRAVVWLTAIACVCTVCFTLLDNLLTVVWYAYSARAARVYFMASLSFMIPQVICTAVSVGVLFIPMWKVFLLVKRSLKKE